MIGASARGRQEAGMLVFFWRTRGPDPRGSMSAVHWVGKCRGGTEPRSGALMRMRGCLEMRSGWCFRVKHVKGISNTLADGISQWERIDGNRHLHESLHVINVALSCKFEKGGSAG